MWTIGMTVKDHENKVDFFSIKF